MNQTEQLPLAGRPRRRSWIDILLLQPLSSNPQMALVLTRRGRVFGVIPAGSTHVLSDYIDWPCEIIEVDGRERRLSLDLALESHDSGRYFQAALQIIYVVVRPERVALEIDDALGELERTIVTAIQATARPLTIDQPAILKESIQELIQQSGSLAVRIASLGLALRRADITIDIAPADREFAERMHDFHRERSFACRILVESLDPRISFDAQVAGAYRYRSRQLLNSGPDQAEFTIREVIAKSIRRVGIEYAPHEYREATHAIAEALRTNPILAAELGAAELELLRPVVDIHPARPMLTVAMQTRLLPAPADDTDDPFERILPAPAAYVPLTIAAPAIHPAPIALSPMISEQLNPTQPIDPVTQSSEEETVSAPPEAAQPLFTPAYQTETIDPSGWNVDSNLFAADPIPESVPSWLQNLDNNQSDQDAIAQELPQEDAVEEDQPSWPEEEETAFDQHTQLPALPVLATTAQDIALQISRWLQLLRSDGDEEFERLALVIIERPDRLSAVLKGLIRDPVFLQNADNPTYQQCLADELEHHVERPDPPAWLAEAPTDSVVGISDSDQQTLPEWLRVS